MAKLPRLDVDVNEVAKFKSPRSTLLGRIFHALEVHGKDFAVSYASKHGDKKYFNNAKKSIDKQIASKPELAKREKEMQAARLALKNGPKKYTKSKTEIAKEKAAAYKKKLLAKKKAMALRSQKSDPKAQTRTERQSNGRTVQNDLGNSNENIRIIGDGNSNVGNNYSNNNGSQPAVNRPVNRPQRDGREGSRSENFDYLKYLQSQPGRPQPNTPPSTPSRQGFGNYKDWSDNRYSPRTYDFQDGDGDGVDDRDQAGPGQPKFSDYVDGKPPTSGNAQDTQLARPEDRNPPPRLPQGYRPANGYDGNRYKPSRDAQAYKDLYSSNLKVNKVGNDYKKIDIYGNNNSNIGNDYSVNISSKNGKGLNNMQGAMAYIGLNQNRAAKNRGEFNPYSTANQTMKAVDDTAGKDVDRRAYNAVGITANYFGDRAKVQDNFTLGDVWKMKAPEYVVPESDNNFFGNYSYT